MKTPESSQAPDLIRIVSWMRLCCEKLLFEMVIAAHDKKVTFMFQTEEKTSLTVLAHQGDQRRVITPNHILHWRTVDLRNRFLLLNVIEHNRSCRAENEAGSAAVKDFICLNRWLDRFDNRI